MVSMQQLQILFDTIVILNIFLFKQLILLQFILKLNINTITSIKTISNAKNLNKYTIKLICFKYKYSY